MNHGLKQVKIVNNTIIMPAHSFLKANSYGIYLQDNKPLARKSRNVNSFIQNNIIYGYNNESLMLSATMDSLVGITISHNLFFSENASSVGAFRSWLSTGYQSLRRPNTVSIDKIGRVADPIFVDIQHFKGLADNQFDYAKADLKGGSPAFNSGTPMMFKPAVNFAGALRKGWNIGAY